MTKIILAAIAMAFTVSVATVGVAEAKTHKHHTMMKKHKKPAAKKM